MRAGWHWRHGKGRAMDIRDTVLRFMGEDVFAVGAGMEIVELEAGRSRVRMPVTTRVLNGHGVVHGGALFTLADYAGAAAVNGLGRRSMAAGGTISFLKPTRSGTLTADAVVERGGRTLATVLVRVTNEKNELVALFQGTAFRTEEELGAAAGNLKV